MEKTKPIVRVAKVTAGLTLLPVGVVMLVLPGPGLAVVVASLILLQDEFLWAGKARDGMLVLGRRGKDWLKQRAR